MSSWYSLMLLFLLGRVDGVQLVKKMWEYIKANNLQNTADRREILLDENLKQVFKVNKFTAFSMNKYLSAHVKNGN